MEATKKTEVSIETTVSAPVEKAWEYFTIPEHVTQWNFASDEWHSPRAENDLKPGGRFSYRMEAKDGSMGFDFSGTYDEVKPKELIRYTMDDDRKASVRFSPSGSNTHVGIVFEAESSNPVDMQKMGWQAILDNFKKYTEG